MEDRVIPRIQSKVWFDKNDPIYSVAWYFTLNMEALLTLIPLTFLFYTHKSLVAFKITMITFFGQYLVLVMKFINYEPHPYWSSKEIRTIDFFNKKNDCQHQDFSMPSNSIFHSIVLNGLLIYSYGVKEYRTTQVHMPTGEKAAYRRKLIVVGVLQIVVVLINCFLKVFYGSTYFYQIVITVLYAFLTLVIVIQFDDAIEEWFFKLGYQRKNSRILKFKCFFFMIGALAFAEVLVACTPDVWLCHVDWIQNSITVSL